MRMADFRDQYLALDQKRRKRFARLAKTTTGYIRTHLIAPPTRRRIPRPDLIDRMVKAGQLVGMPISKQRLLAYFYEDPGGDAMT